MSTRTPPEGEDPVRVRTEILWRNATATVAIPEVFVYSTGIYFGVDYRTTDVPPPARGETLEDRRRVADEATERVRTRLRLTERIRVNGARPGVIDVESFDRGFTVWFWSAFQAHSGGQPANAALIQLNWPEFPGADATVPYPPPGSPTVPGGDVPPHGEAPALVRTDIPPQGEDPVVVRPEIRPEFPGADATFPYPPPGTPTAPAPSVPRSWCERGKNWGQTTTVLRSSPGHPD